MSLSRVTVVAVGIAVTGFLSVVVAKEKPEPPALPEEPAELWREQVRLPEDPFLIHGTGWNEPAWVKFTIVSQSDGSQKVYFQDGNEYRFHYEFAVAHLAPFAGMTRTEFDHVTLYRESRQAVLGAVVAPALMALSSQPREYGIQLVGYEPFAKEEIVALFDVIKSSVVTEEEFRAFYFPTYEQQAAAEADRAWLAARGIEISSPTRWADDNICYSSGWAIGVLKQVEGHAIHEAYRSGTLGPDDILLTDGVPAEIPFVAGILTLAPATPNSHVAILAKTSNIPFVHLAVAATQDLAWQLVGHRICLRAFDRYGWTDIRLMDLEGVLDETTVQEILTLKRPPQLDISPMTPYGSYAMSTDALVPSDIRYFGGKAANYGILRRAIPEHSPVAAAFSFDLWHDFLSQNLADGHSLRETIAAYLGSFRYPPADVAALSSALADIRALFTDASATQFTQQQEQAVLAALQDPVYGFDILRNLRFRSSTNVEDGREFTGAGLYESYSGCLADDLDDDTDGPCLCDPNRGRERGVFTVIRKVFASFYNENAYLERLRHGVNEAEVGMAMLVHHSFPDEFELANGVAAVKRDSEWGWEMKLVTQRGATSVTNPQDGSIPEEVMVTIYEFGTYAEHVRQSNLVQLGATVMQWDADYVELGRLLVKVGEEFAATTGRKQFVLEMEYKKIVDPPSSQADADPGTEPPAPGRLIVKQVREIPQPDDTPSLTPFLINEPTEYCILQGEFGNIFANHRLKSQWQLETGSFWLTEKQLGSSLYKQAAFEYLAQDAIGSLAGSMSQWPQASHAHGESGTTDAWRLADLPNPRSYRLYTNNIPTLVSPAESAVLTLRDFRYLTLEVEYEQPVMQVDWTGPIGVTTEQVLLWPRPQPTAEDLLQRRRFGGPDGVSIETSFYWPPPPKGPTAGYTAPLARWVETRIEGYTREPIVLHGDYSQTYKPGHHNFSEDFLFEPQLEPGLSSDILAELRERDVRLIHVRSGMAEPVITTYGYAFDAGPFLQADLNGDGRVDNYDFAVFARLWRDSGCLPCGRPDLSYDGWVTLPDLQKLAEQWLLGCAPQD